MTPRLGARAIATAEAIELAALRLFCSQSYEDTTADEIAAAAGTSVRTYFRYFPRGKEDVMVLEFRRWVQHLQTAMNDRPPQESAWTAARAALRSIPTLVSDGGVLSAEAVLMHREIARQNPDLHARMTGYQHELLEPFVRMAALRMSVDPTVDLRPRLMVYMIVSAATVAWLAWLDDRENDGFASLENALDIVEGGLAAAMG